jgi:hypothetical protein
MLAYAPHYRWITGKKGKEAKAARQRGDRRKLACGARLTLKRFRFMSALPPKADIAEHHRQVRFVPKADIRPAHFMPNCNIIRLVRQQAKARCQRF